MDNQDTIRTLLDAGPLVAYLYQGPMSGRGSEWARQRVGEAAGVSAFTIVSDL